MMPLLENKVVFVSGGSQGLGAAIARAAVREGARVVVTGRRPEPGEKLVAEFADQGVAALFVQADVSDDALFHAAKHAEWEAYAAERFPELLDDLEEHWDQAGARDRLRTERFRPTVLVTGEGGTVSFTTTGTTLEADGGTPILDAAEEAGLLMPSGCRMGICYGCVLPLREGAVRDLRTGEITTAAPGDGVLVQTCISAAAGACDIDH